MNRNLIGTVDKIKLVSSFPDMLLRCTLIVGDEFINCIVADRSIGNQLMFLEEGKTEVAIFGQWNSRNQLFIKKMMIRKPNSFERTFAMTD